jgi:hypothetical protein
MGVGRWYLATRNSAIFPCCVTITLYYWFHSFIRCIWIVFYRIHGCRCWFRLLSTWRPHLGDTTEVPQGPPSFAFILHYLYVCMKLIVFFHLNVVIFTYLFIHITAQSRSLPPCRQQCPYGGTDHLYNYLIKLLQFLCEQCWMAKWFLLIWSPSLNAQFYLKATCRC